MDGFFLLAFTCHDQGASSVVYAPQHQLIISAGKKGDVCIFDVRQRLLRHRFQVSGSWQGEREEIGRIDIIGLFSSRHTTIRLNAWPLIHTRSISSPGQLMATLRCGV